MKHAIVSICSLLLLAGAARAQSMTGDAPAILQPKNGATVSSPVTVMIRPGTAGSTMAGMATDQHGAHMHLIIDAPLPAAGKMVPMDARHIHLMHGETEKTVTLKPGSHTMRLIEGSASHVIEKDAPRSDPVTFEVK